MTITLDATYWLRLSSGCAAVVGRETTRQQGQQVMATCVQEFGKALLSREIEWEGMHIDATVEVSGSVISDGSEGIGWGRRVDQMYDPELKSLSVCLGEDRMPKPVERLMMEHLHDRICELVLADVGDTDVQAAILDAAH